MKRSTITFDTAVFEILVIITYMTTSTLVKVSYTHLITSSSDFSDNLSRIISCAIFSIR